MVARALVDCLHAMRIPRDQVRLEYKDEHGRDLTPKEAFRHVMTHSHVSRSCWEVCASSWLELSAVFACVTVSLRAARSAHAALLTHMARCELSNPLYRWRPQAVVLQVPRAAAGAEEESQARGSGVRLCACVRGGLFLMCAF